MRPQLHVIKLIYCTAACKRSTCVFDKLQHACLLGVSISSIPVVSQGSPFDCLSLPGSVLSVWHHFRTLPASKYHQQICSLSHRIHQTIHSKAGSSVEGIFLGAARTKLAKAGISKEATEHALKQCKTYSIPNFATKLKPAIQMWVSAIGAHELSNRLMQTPRTMLTSPLGCNNVNEWFPSLKVDANRVQQSMLQIPTREFSDYQSIVSAVQQGVLSKGELLWMVNCQSAIHSKHMSRPSK